MEIKLIKKKKRNKDDGSLDRSVEIRVYLNILRQTKVFAFSLTTEIIKCVIF